MRVRHGQTVEHAAPPTRVIVIVIVNVLAVIRAVGELVPVPEVEHALASTSA